MPALMILTLSRGPLALFFLSDSIFLRITSVICAMLTDSIDGWLARKLKSTSRLGAILDPIMDKFFVYFVITILMLEAKISPVCSLALVSRDLSLMIFSIYLAFTKQFNIKQLKSILLGKISTALQFATIIALSCGTHLSPLFYISFVILATLALAELFWLQLELAK
jgi:CDP-diacylglycerol--glycerol-3-phosphate 3-phosphatidyltransferase